MKNLIRTLPAKITCFILCIVLLGVTVASIFGAVILVDNGFYTNSKEYMLEDSMYGLFCNDSYSIVWYASEPQEGLGVERNYLSADNTNLRFKVLDSNGNVIAKNTESTFDNNPSIWEYSRYYAVRIVNGERFVLDLGPSISTDDAYTGIDKNNIYTVWAYLENDLPIGDKYALAYNLISIGYSMLYAIYPIGIFSFLLAVVCFIILMCSSARKPNSDEIHPGPLNRVPIDLLVAAIFVFFAVCIALIVDIFYTGELLQIILLLVLVIMALYIGLGLSMSVAARIKQGTMFSNTVIWMCLKLLWKALKWMGRGIKKVARMISEVFLNIPLIWRTLLIVAGVSLIEFFIIVVCWYESEVIAIFWLLEKVIFVPVVIYGALILRKLQAGGNALAKGDLSYQVDTNLMFWDFKRHGENLNSIADGMATAVEQRLQGERMKTELITNVSHDIKTPLTSIINYAGLIGEESCDKDNHKEYARVLVRKSEHLKRLLDDLVEISKATSGNLEVVLSPCEAGVLLTQTAGEFEQRCQAAELELITSQPDSPIRIMADSRRIWRVFENLMNNACKYSLTGSRVYLSLEKIGNEAVFTFRNTSRTALNISPEELMERFVRGDTSRSTEGNGLGLSIARSLTELQNGKMDIVIDGDLFKVTLRFPTV